MVYNFRIFRWHRNRHGDSSGQWRHAKSTAVVPSQIRGGLRVIRQPATMFYHLCLPAVTIEPDSALPRRGLQGRWFRLYRQYEPELAGIGGREPVLSFYDDLEPHLCGQYSASLGNDPAECVKCGKIADADSRSGGGLRLTDMGTTRYRRMLDMHGDDMSGICVAVWRLQVIPRVSCCRAPIRRISGSRAGRRPTSIAAWRAGSRAGVRFMPGTVDRSHMSEPAR